VQNLNLRHIYLVGFLIFGVFFARLASKFEKVLISNPVKKFLKNASKKVISKTSLTNMSKSGKSAYLCHIFANNFLKTFSTDLKSA
jgi:hypothetical protein